MLSVHNTKRVERSFECADDIRETDLHRSAYFSAESLRLLRFFGNCVPFICFSAISAGASGYSVGPQYPDSIGYMRLADGLRTGCGFAPRWQNGTCGPAEIERTPGYPVFLATYLACAPYWRFRQYLAQEPACSLDYLRGVIGGSCRDHSGIVNWFRSLLNCSNNIGTETLFTWIIILAILLQLQLSVEPFSMCGP